jgi:hypothetical protein
MSRAYGKESKIHIKRSGNNDSEIAWAPEKNQKIFQMKLIIIRKNQELGAKENPRKSRGLSDFIVGSVWMPRLLDIL